MIYIARLRGGHVERDADALVVGGCPSATSLLAGPAADGACLYLPRSTSDFSLIMVMSQLIILTLLVTQPGSSAWVY